MMVIGGKEIRKYQCFKRLDDYYFQAIKSIARESLSELKFVNIETHNVSKSSDSIYFKFKLNHHKDSFTLSLRTHPPREETENYFYFYLYDYESLAKLKREIQRRLIIRYNKKAYILGIAKEVSEYKKKPHSHRASPKKKKKSRTEICSLLHSDESFHQLMREINSGSQSIC